MAQLGVPWENLRWPVDLGSAHQESGWAAADNSVLWCPALLGFFLDVLPRTEKNNGVLRCFWRCFELFLFLNMPGCPRISLKNVRDHISPEDWRRSHCPRLCCGELTVTAAAPQGLLDAPGRFPRRQHGQGHANAGWGRHLVTGIAGMMRFVENEFYRVLLCCCFFFFLNSSINIHYVSVYMDRLYYITIINDDGWWWLEETIPVII